jgi:hypothetical protein
MRKFLLLFAVALLGTFGIISTAFAGGGGNFTAHLSGNNEVPSNDSKAQGQAIFHLSKDGTSVDYKVIATRTNTPVANAHIHLAPPGVNGGVVVTLCGSPGPAPVCGSGTGAILVKGTFTSDNLRGALAGASLDDLIGMMEDGQAYVNAHTADFPGGEIRGQIK